jgi:starch phosphorylase
MGLKPTVWHINEGHAAFMILERIRHLTTQGIEIAAAVEAVAAHTVFTTHTAVPAGHDHFSDDMIRRYFEHACKELGVSTEHAAGAGPRAGRPRVQHDGAGGARLALPQRRLAHPRRRLGAHPRQPVAADRGRRQPVTYVTNGVHVPTFLVQRMERAVRPFPRPRLDPARHRQELLGRHPHHSRPPSSGACASRSKRRCCIWCATGSPSSTLRNQGSEAHLDRAAQARRPDNPNVLTIGFARRFATYKRAALLFNNLDWLREILCDPQRPVLFLFAGKAHPADQPGQALIRRSPSFRAMPEFEGRILLVEGYDLHLARRLVAGVDVWLNNPIYPLEASRHLGHEGGHQRRHQPVGAGRLVGRGLRRQERLGHQAGLRQASTRRKRDHEEARTLYETAAGQRDPVLSDYLSRFYVPAAQQWRRYSQDNYAGARAVAQWKSRVRSSWPQVALRRLDAPKRRIGFGDSLRFEVAVKLDGLQPGDVVVELLFGRPSGGSQPKKSRSHRFHHERQLETGEQLYALDLTPEYCGKIEYRIRIYPHHDLLTHPFEMGMMVWL